jgi:hypothetical protein
MEVSTDQSRVGQGRIAFDYRRQCEAVHFGHLAIQERDIVRLAIFASG